MDMAVEQRVLDACRAGDTAEYRKLVEAYFPRAVRLASAVVGDAGDGEDLAQEAFVAAYRALPKHIEGRPFFPWLRGILRNRCRTFLRSRRRATRRRVTAQDVPDHWAQARPRSPGSRQRRVVDLVQRGMSALDDDDRTLLVLKHVEGFTYDELAAQLGIPPGTVMSRLYRARNRLRDVLQELDPSLLAAEPPGGVGLGAEGRQESET